MKIYIAGKVTGLDRQAALDKFADSERKLVAAGIDPKNVVNPMKLGIPETEEWHIAMEKCMQHLTRCTAVFVQSDWRDSFGARREITEAMNARMDLFYEEAGDINMIKNIVQLL